MLSIISTMTIIFERPQNQSMYISKRTLAFLNDIQKSGNSRILINTRSYRQKRIQPYTATVHRITENELRPKIKKRNKPTIHIPLIVVIKSKTIQQRKEQQKIRLKQHQLKNELQFLRIGLGVAGEDIIRECRGWSPLNVWRENN